MVLLYLNCQYTKIIIKCQLEICPSLGVDCCNTLYVLNFPKAMAEMMAENYHNIWAKKKKMELEAKGNVNYKYLLYFKFCLIILKHKLEKMYEPELL